MAPDQRGGAARAAPLAALVGLVAAAAGVTILLIGMRADLRLQPGAATRAAAATTGTSPTASNSPAVTTDPQHPGSVVLVDSVDAPADSASLAWSSDGGATWGHTPLPLPSGSDRPHAPDAAFAPDGTLYVLYVNLQGRANLPDHLWLSRSDDAGRTLSAPVLVAGADAFEGRLAVGPQGTVYVTWLQALGVGQYSLIGPPSPIVEVHSGDGGRTFSSPVRVSDAGRARVGAAIPVVASDGSLLVLYEDFKGDVRDFQNLEGPVWPEPFALVVTRSTDGGTSFAPGREAEPDVVPVERFLPYAPAFPSIAAGPDGSLVIAWPDGRSGAAEVLLRRSTDLGADWGAPVIVGAAPGGAVEHRLPTVAVAPDGRIDVLYIAASSAASADAYLATSPDNARRFAVARLSAAPFDPRIAPAHAGPAFLPPDLGSHLGLASDDNGARAAWTETAGSGSATAQQAVTLDRVDVSGPGSRLATALSLALFGIAGIGLLLALATVRPATTAAVGARAVAAGWWASGLRRPPAPRRPAAPPRHLRLGRREYPVVLPTLRDPRMHVAACILSVQVLGQVALGFQVSVAQILVSLGTCAVLEVGLTFAQRRTIIWPASALLTGNGVALLMRVPGTRHGDWWSLHGAAIFVFAAVLSLLSKYIVRAGGRPVFNPSNFGLVVTFLVFGSTRTDPQDLWWGPWSPGLVLALAIIVIGGLVIVRRLKMLPMVAAFMVSWTAFVTVIAIGGHCITARWYVGPLCGYGFWSVFVTSPEILVFMFFMLTDPQTAPRGQPARLAYGVGLAFLAALLVAPLQTEFSAKIGILGALVLVCALQPLGERVLAARRARGDHVSATGPRVRRGAARVLGAGAGALVVFGGSAGILTAAAIPARQPAPGAVEFTVPASQLKPRPAVAVAAAALPPAQISPAARSAYGTLTDAMAARMERDLLEDLMIEASAVQTLDPGLAATAAIGPSLQRAVQEIDAARSAGKRVVPGYRLTAVDFVLASDPNNYQASPQLAVEVRGSVEQVTYAGTSGVQVSSRSTVPLDRILVLQLVGAHFLLVGDYTQS